MRHQLNGGRGRRRARLLFAAATAVAGISSSARALVINPTFDSSITGQSNAAQIEGAINYAIQQYEGLYSNSITINIDFKLANLGANALGQSGFGYVSASYAQVSSKLSGLTATPAQILSAAHLPGSDPNPSEQWRVNNADAKALGLLDANDSGTDGTVTFNSVGTAFTFDPFDRAVSGGNTYDFIGTAEHEISEVMGRASDGNFNVPFILMHYSSPGVRDFAQKSNDYFSVDGGVTNLKDFSNPATIGGGGKPIGGDSQDWLNNSTFGSTDYVPDAYNSFSDSGIENPLSNVDVTVMNVLGYNPTSNSLAWFGGNGDPLTGFDWDATGQVGINPHHGANLTFGSSGETASHAFASNENWELSNLSDAGLTLTITAGTVRITSTGTNGNGQGIVVNQDGVLTVNNHGTLSLAGELSIGDNSTSTNAQASFSGNSLINVGAVSGTQNTFYIGAGSVGTVTQSGNSVVTAPNLDMGLFTSGAGNYTLSNSATLSVTNDEYVGHQGSGNFNQTGGINSVAGLFVGYNATATGLFTLSNSGKLIVGGDGEIIGDAGVGIFTQSGGTNTTTGGLYVANTSSSSGTYFLENTATLTNLNDEDIGEKSLGSFYQSGGMQTVQGNIYLGGFSTGTGYYVLYNAGQLTLQSGLFVGDEGVGTFNQSGSSANSVSGIVELGSFAGITGTYLLSGSATLSVGSDEIVGDSGSGVFNQSGGTNSITGILYLAGAVGSSGTFNLSGSGALSAAGGEIIGDGGAAIFNQSGGSNSVGETGQFIVGGTPGATETYLLSGGMLTGPGFGFEYIGYIGAGMFNQSGGTHNADDIDIGYAGSTGTYILSSSGTLSASSESVGVGGRGTFNQSGGSNTVGELNLAEDSASKGTYNLTGGTLAAANVYVGGDFLFSGGVGVLNVSNNGLLNVSGTLEVYSTASNSINLSGGTINTAALDTNGAPGNFNWTAGTLGLTSGVVLDGSADPTTTSAAFGASLLLSPGMTLNVTGIETLGGTAAFSLTIGDFGSGGNPTNSISNDLHIGHGSTLSMLPVNLSVPILTVQSAEFIGIGGTGSFVQEGGSNTAGVAGADSLILGQNSADLGIYSMSSPSFPFENSFLTVTGNEIVGSRGTGIFTQSGGTNAFSGGILYIGLHANSTGTYNLSGNAYLFAQGSEDIGVTGAGVFVQTGGTNHVDNFLTIGDQPGGTGSYTLSAGTLSGGIFEYVGAGGAGTFNQTGGTHNAVTMDIGQISGSTGSYTLSGGVLNASGIYVGGSSAGAGGTGVLTINGSGKLGQGSALTVWNKGRVNLDVASTSVSGLTMSGKGIVNLNGTLNINYGSPGNDPVTSVASYLKSGYNGGAWTGTSGIISTSVSGGAPTPALALGYADGNSDIGTAAVANQIVVKYTLAGDANLDGLVNFNDLVAVVQNFNKSGADWAHGDFHYGPSTNFNDLVAVVQNFNKTLPPPGGTGVELGGSAVPLVSGTDAQLPEPGGIMFIAACAGGLLARRRKSRAM